MDWNLRERNVGTDREVCRQFLFQNLDYLAWSARNAFCCVGDGSKLRYSYRQVLAQAKQVQTVLQKEGKMEGKKLMFISWVKPPKGWMKVNVDGATTGNLAQAGVKRTNT